jgi:hypothetical protein
VGEWCCKPAALNQKAHLLPSGKLNFSVFLHECVHISASACIATNGEQGDKQHAQAIANHRRGYDAAYTVDGRECR